MTSSTNALLNYANTALAAYASPALADATYKDHLVLVDMAPAQADAFIDTFRVVDYFNDTIGSGAAGIGVFGSGPHIPSGVSATVFERKSTGEKVLAIRGTTPTDAGDLWTDLVDIILYGSSKHQYQYAALTTKVDEWLANGTLSPGFTVTGHSLGGFLAVALTADLDATIGHAYAFNAPGLGGFQVSSLSKSFNEWLADIRPDMPAPDGNKVTNVTAQGGTSLVSGLGIPVGDRIDVAVETPLLPSLSPADFLASHRIEKLTDALAVYDLLAKIDPGITLDTSNLILEAAAPDNSETLERVLNVVAPLLGLQPTAAGDIPRDDLFAKIDEIGSAVTTPSPYHIIPLVSFSGTYVAQLALGDISVRHALKQLHPFALSGAANMFDAFNGSGQLELAGNGGALTANWLADRAGLLGALGWINTYEDGNTIRSDTGPSRDFVSIRPGLDPQVIRVAGPEGLAPAAATAQIVFGSDQADTLAGHDAPDRLYGEAGNDTLHGGRSADYLEGGTGDDELNGDAGYDRLVGGAGDDTLDGGSGGDRLEGGPGTDTYLVHANQGLGGFATIADSDGHGQIRLDGVALTGGKEVRPGEYRSADGNTTYWFSGSLDETGTLFVGGDVEIENFRNGELGIRLTPEWEPSEPVAGGERIYLDFPYDQESVSLWHPGEPNPQEPHYPWGSPDADTFIAGPNAGANFLGLGGNDHLIGGGNYYAELLGGAGDDWIENREITNVQGTGDHIIAGEAGRDVLQGSNNDEHLYGDFYSIRTDTSTPGHFTIRIDEFAVTTDSDGHTWGGHHSFWNVTDFYNDLGFNYYGPLMPALVSYLGFDADTQPDDIYDDIIDGGGGNDVIFGGPGNDEIHGGAGNDRIYGDAPPPGSREEFENSIRGSQFDPYRDLFGRPGEDIIDGGDGNDEIYDRGPRSSVAIGGAGDDLIDVLISRDPTLPEAAVIVIDGGDGNDDLSALGLADEIGIDAGAGDDRIHAWGNTVFIDGGTGSDSYDVGGVDIWIRDNDPDSRNADTLIFRSTGTGFYFSRDGDDLLINSSLDLSEFEQVGPDGEDEVASTVRIDDWFAGASHQIEQIVLAPLGWDETLWTPQDIERILDDAPLAWAGFVQPESPAPEPIVLAATPPDPTPPPEPPDDPPDDPPAPPDDAEDDSPPPDLPPPAPDSQDDAPGLPPAVIPVNVLIADADFNGRIDGTSASDTFAVFSSRGAAIDAGAGDDHVATGSGDDQIMLGAGDDIALTAGGDDEIVIDRFEGAKTIDAGPGIDTLTISIRLESIVVSTQGDRIVFRDAAGNSLDTANVNVFEFANAVVYREGNDSEDDVSRLYETVLGQAADPARPILWLDQLITGGSFAGERPELRGQPDAGAVFFGNFNADALAAEAPIVITGAIPIQPAI